MLRQSAARLVTGCCLINLCVLAGAAAERTTTFDHDPGWDALNNRSSAFEPKNITQDFGYSPTHHAGGEQPGEMGGSISPAAEAAYYALPLETHTFDDRLTASGTLNCTGRVFHALIAFFNDSTLNEWRTPNMIAIRINGRGDRFFAYAEYCTSMWRAGGDDPGGFATEIEPETGRSVQRGFPLNQVLHWSLTYDPQAHDGVGSITITIGDQTCICHLTPEHRADGATFNRFGLLPVMKQWDDAGEVWLDDVKVNGQTEHFTTDPQWDQRNNRRTYVSTNVRPRFDFGYSETHFAGGKAAGELGGLVFRGDIRYPERMAYYGDRLEPLTWERPLHASGKMTMRRGVTDSTVLLGFFHHQESVRTNDSQQHGLPHSFLGLAIEGPSRDGFLVYPVYRNAGPGNGSAQGSDRPHIYPDGATHDWSIDYDPTSGAGRIAVTFDGHTVRLDVPSADRQVPTTFDRFGLVTTWIDGNGQHIYFDDLTYTVRQE